MLLVSLCFLRVIDCHKPRKIFYLTFILLLMKKALHDLEFYVEYSNFSKAEFITKDHRGMSQRSGLKPGPRPKSIPALNSPLKPFLQVPVARELISHPYLWETIKEYRKQGKGCTGGKKDKRPEAFPDKSTAINVVVVRKKKKKVRKKGKWSRSFCGENRYELTESEKWYWIMKS